MADLSFITKSTNETKTDLSFIKDNSNETKTDLNFINDNNTVGKTDLSFINKTKPNISKEQELIDLGLLPSKDNAITRILGNAFGKDSALRQRYADVGVPEGAKIAGSQEEKDFFKINTVPMDKTKVLGMTFNNPISLYEKSDGVLDFANNVSKYIASDIIGAGYSGLNQVWKATESLIDVPIDLITQSIEETVLATLGEEGFADLEKKIFNSSTVKAKNIAEHLKEVIYIGLADTASRAPKLNNKQIFNDQLFTIEKAIKTDQQKIVNNVIKKNEKDPLNTIPKNDYIQLKEEFFVQKNKERLEPYLLEAENKIIDYASNLIGKETNKDPMAVKSTITNIYNQNKIKNDVPKYLKNIFSFRKNNTKRTLEQAYKESEGAKSFSEIKAVFRPSEIFRRIEKEFPEIRSIVEKNKGITQPISRQTILSNFVKDLKVPVTQKKQGKALGVYFHDETVTSLYKYDLNTIAHEMGHFINGRFPKITKNYRENFLFDKELKAISYDKFSNSEGFAEFIRLYLNKPEMVQKYAPNFYQWFDSNLKKGEFSTYVGGKLVNLDKALLNAQKEFSSYWNQGSLARLQSNIGFTKDINKGVASSREYYYADLVDALYGLKRAGKDLGFGDVLYDMAKQERGGMYISQNIIEKGIPYAKLDPKTKLGNPKRFTIEYTGKGFVEVLTPVSKELDNFILYATSRSAKETYSQGRENLFKLDQIKAGLELETPLFIKVFDDLQTWQKGIADFAQNYGKLFTKEQRKRWDRVDYIPFKRENTGFFSRSLTNSNISADFKGIKMLTGGRENLRPILSNIINNASALVEASIQNRFKLEMLDFFTKERYLGTGRFIHILKEAPRAIRSKAITKDIIDTLSFELQKRLEKIGMPYKDIGTAKNMLKESGKEAGSLLEVLIPEKKPKRADGKTYMPVRRNGKTEYYEVRDELLFIALNNLKPKSISEGIIKNYISPLRVVSQNMITLAFNFISNNALRDTISSWVLSKAGYIPFKDFLIGLKSRITKDKNYREFIENGGGRSSIYANEASVRRKLDDFYNSKGIVSNLVINTPRKFFRALETFGDAIESASRLGEKRLLKKQGKDMTDQIVGAKEITVDFGTRGAYNTSIGQFLEVLENSFLFLRAAKLGMDRVYRAGFKDKHKKRVQAKVVGMATASMGLAVINNDNPMYQKLQDWDKDSHWHFFTPTINGAWGKYFIETGEIPNPQTYEEAIGFDPATGNTDPLYTHRRLPKPWEIGSINTVAERMTLGLINETLDAKEAWHMTTVLLNNLRFNPNLPIFTPIYENIINKNTFTDRPIINPYEQQNLESYLQGSTTASETSKATSEYLFKKFGINNSTFSAPMIDNYIKGLLHTFGQYGLLISDKIFFDEAEDLSINQYPVIGQYVRDPVNKSSTSVSKAFELIADMTKADQSFAHLLRDYALNDDNELLEMYIEEEGKVYDAGLSKTGNKIKQEFTEANSLIKNIKRSNKLSVVQQLAEIVATKGNADVSEYIQNLKNLNIYYDIGALKQHLNNDIIIRRDILAEEFVKVIEQIKVEPF